MHYNTTNENGVDLIKFELNEKRQKDNVLKLFNKFKSLSPSFCLSKYKIYTGKTNTPITSIRRAISDLTDEGYLVMTTKKMYGNYGRKEHFWKLNK